MDENKRIVQFVPFTTFVHPSFWHTLTETKLNVDRLSDASRQVFGKFTYRDDIGTVFEVDGTSFNSAPSMEAFYQPVTGTLMNKNTIGELRTMDKKALLNSVGEVMFSNIGDNNWIENPSVLLTFIIVSFADLKKYNYFYWFAFPAPTQCVLTSDNISATQKFDSTQLQEICKQFKLLDENQKPFFVIILSEGKIILKTISEILNKDLCDQSHFEFDFESMIFAFLDPSNGENPGWPLRTYVAAIICHCPCLIGLPLKFFGLRMGVHGNIDKSRIFEIVMPLNSKFGDNWVGWEPNDKGGWSARMVNLSESMDPVKLADTSANLNLQLMKWRIVPSLNLEIMKETKCLLLGAGTLGCHVARNLIAWGFRNITFFDNGVVSYSNPTRQVLFNHQDSIKLGRKKAEAAADNLKLVLPSVNAKSIIAHIPMPDHPVGKFLLDETKENIAALTDAIQSHDVIFLLLDTREARWMPTVIASKLGKIVICAALGFDSYLVMRHGIQNSSNAKIKGLDAKKYVAGANLACYFCNDVTAPGNSMKDRTLDQQCTVTRPGVASIAGALAVEMVVSILQHPLRLNAPACNIKEETDHPALTESILGPIPHSIRSYLSTYQTIFPTCTKFKQCIACSNFVIDKYKDEGETFFLKVLNDATYLEDITGLKKLREEAENMKLLTFNDFTEEPA